MDRFPIVSAKPSKILTYLFRGVVLAALGTILFVLLQSDKPSSETNSLSNSLLVFVLLNASILSLLILAFLVARNVAKLLFERKLGVLGSRLRLKLVGAFILFSSFPLAASFIVSSGLLSNAIEGWVSPPIEQAVSSSLDIAREHVNWLRNVVQETGDRFAAEFSDFHVQEGKNIASQLDTFRKSNDLHAVYVTKTDGTVLFQSARALSSVDQFSEPPLDIDAIQHASKGDENTRIEERESAKFVRAYVLCGINTVGVVSYRLSPELSGALESVNDAYKAYEELKFYKQPLRSNTLLLFALFNLLTIFGAVWFGFYLAKQITGPVQRLLEGTEAVAGGNYSFRIDLDREDEFGTLTKSFNTMLEELKTSRDIAERRRVLIETIVSNLAVGVLTLDENHRVTSINDAAKKILNIHFHDGELEIFLPETFRAEVEDLLRAIEDDQEAESHEKELRIEREGRELVILCTAGAILSPDAKQRGTVLLLDDLTDISEAQHHAAWREVAKRIAHEIKNPLTPIQLSAQRLEKLCEGSESAAVKEATHTIVEHVNLIKRLVNEFSDFARMPTAEFQLTYLNQLLSDTVLSFAELNDDLSLQFIGDNDIPQVMLDPEQIRGVVLNLLQNAADALRENPSADDPPKITVRSWYERKIRSYRLEVIDNGPGIPARDKVRIFEPYYTTKKTGTGLGLAIATSAVREHQGEIRAYDHEPRGTKFIITLPTHPRHPTQRKLMQ